MLKHEEKDGGTPELLPSELGGEGELVPRATFAALRFTEDDNIRDRVYWYRLDFPARTGGRVLAPVGSHDRLQCARVERILEADERDAPYDVSLIKRVAAPYGARSFLWEGRTCYELGGVRYDQKRFTRFHVFACLFGEPPASAPAGYTIVPVSGGEDFFEREETFELFARLAGLREGALLCGEEGPLKLLASALLELAGAKGKRPLPPPGARAYLADLGYPQEVLERLAEKLR